MKTANIDSTAALVVEALHDLGVDDDGIADLTGMHVYDIGVMIAERERERSYERGRTLALSAANARLNRQVAVLERKLQAAGK